MVMVDVHATVLATIRVQVDDFAADSALTMLALMHGLQLVDGQSVEPRSHA
jgi:hypothetical protein